MKRNESQLEELNLLIGDKNYNNLTKKERLEICEPVRNTPKISRNSICGCGSGKKYKNCHIAIAV